MTEFYYDINTRDENGIWNKDTNHQQQQHIDDDDEVILLKPPLWKHANPKLYGGPPWLRYEAYKHTKTFEEAKSCGCTLRDISFAKAHASTHFN